MNKALLLIDIQNDYFLGGKCELFEPKKALENTVKVLKNFRENGFPIIHVQHINLQEKATFFLPNTYGAEIHNSLMPKPNEDIVVKHFPNSFFETNLQKLLKEKEISELVICGMMTHMCIDTTVRAAKDNGYNITLISDACTTKDLEWNDLIIPANVVQNVYMSSLNSKFADVVTSEIILK